MSERHQQLARISADLKTYIDEFCGTGAEGSNDFIGEKCNDAFLMLQAALQDLESDN